MNRGLFVGLALASACVEDVWLGPARTVAVDAALEDGGTDARDDIDAAASASAGADAGDGGDAAPARAMFCGLDCETAIVNKTCGENDVFVCWTNDTGVCEPTCNPAPRCGRDSDPACLGQTFCWFADKDDPCASSGAGGVCRAYPETCRFELRSEVCGCDGRTYTSECAAAQAGISIASLFACGA